MTAPALHPADVFDLLQGHWHLARIIPGQATIHGTATVTPVPPGEVSLQRKATPRPLWQWRSATNPKILYTEQVQIHTTTGHQLTGTANYLFTQGPSASIDVHLPATGVLFHTLHFAHNTHGHLEAQATHLCAADTYTSTYRVLSPSQLYIEHRVQGPRKHYLTQTTLTRTHPEPATRDAIS